MSTSTLTAYLLVSHGSRDPRPGWGMDRLAQFVRSPESGLALPSARQERSADQSRLTERPLGARYRSPMPAAEAVSGPLVGTACLECEALPLSQQIVAFSRRARAAGATRVRVVPLFLLAGVHVADDIPAEVDRARQLLPDLAIDVSAHLGSHPGLKGLLRSKLRITAAETVVLLGHGSRRPGGHAPVCKLARALGGTAAFWAVAPTLESQVIYHMQSGVQRLAILPYFLFTGTITDTITHLTEDLAERFPQVSLHLLPPLGASLDLARLVVDLALDQVPTKGQQGPTPMPRMAFRHTPMPSSLVS